MKIFATVTGLGAALVLAAAFAPGRPGRAPAPIPKAQRGALGHAPTSSVAPKPARRRVTQAEARKDLADQFLSASARASTVYQALARKGGSVPGASAAARRMAELANGLLEGSKLLPKATGGEVTLARKTLAEAKAAIQLGEGSLKKAGWR